MKEPQPEQDTVASSQLKRKREATHRAGRKPRRTAGELQDPATSVKITKSTFSHQPRAFQTNNEDKRNDKANPWKDTEIQGDSRSDDNLKFGYSAYELVKAFEKFDLGVEKKRRKQKKKEEEKGEEKIFKELVAGDGGPIPEDRIAIVKGRCGIFSPNLANIDRFYISGTKNSDASIYAVWDETHSWLQWSRTPLV